MTPVKRRRQQRAADSVCFTPLFVGFLTHSLTHSRMHTHQRWGSAVPAKETSPKPIAFSSFSLSLCAVGIRRVQAEQVERGRTVVSTEQQELHVAAESSFKTTVCN